MIDGHTDSSPEYAVSLGAYTVEALRPLLDQEDLSPDNVGLGSLDWTLGSFVELSHVAVAQGDVAAYEDWRQYTDEYIDQLRLRNNLDEAFNAHFLTEIQFLGTTSEDSEVAFRNLDALHQFLEFDPRHAKLGRLMGLCVKYDTPAAPWIERHTFTSDEAAATWGRYYLEYLTLLGSRGEYPTGAALRVPGVEAYINDIAEGNLSDQLMLDQSIVAFHLADSPDQKGRIAYHFTSAVERMTHADNFGSSDVSFLSLYRTAALIMASPDVSSVAKESLSEAITDERSRWEGTTPYEREYNLFRVDSSVAHGGSAAALLQEIDDMGARMGNVLQRQATRESLLVGASKAFMESGQFENAAVLISQINNTRMWRPAVEEYMYKEGDPDLLMQADDFRESWLADEPGLPDIPDWQSRNRIVTFLQHMAAENFDQAGQTLLAIARGLTPEQSDTGSIVVTEYARRLLRHSPSQASIGTEMTEVVQRIRSYPNRYELFGLFAAHEVAAAEVASRQLLAEQVSPGSYLYVYAGITAAQITRD